MDQFKDVFDWMVGHWAFCAFVLGVIFEIPKLKLRPFTRLIKWIGSILTRELNSRLDKIDKDIGGLKAELEQVKEENEEQMERIDMNDANRIRTTILDFANSLKNGQLHTQEEFDHIIDQNDLYEKYMEKYHFKNGRFHAAYKYIKECYEDCLKNKTFLP